MKSLFNLRISSKIFKAETKDGFIKAKIKAKDGSWIEFEDYPDNPMGINAIFELAVNAHAGKLLVKGVELKRKQIEKPA